jgi:hypothetical protein
MCPGSEYCIAEAGNITGIGEIISDEGETRAREPHWL